MTAYDEDNERPAGPMPLAEALRIIEQTAQKLRAQLARGTALAQRGHLTYNQSDPSPQEDRHDAD